MIDKKLIPNKPLPERELRNRRRILARRRRRAAQRARIEKGRFENPTTEKKRIDENKKMTEALRQKRHDKLWADFDEREKAGF